MAATSPSHYMKTPAVPGVEQLPSARPTDADLIAALKRREETAVSRLYDRYARLVFSVALQVLGDEGGAEDVRQEVFLQLWSTPETFDSARGPLPSWIAVIARHKAIDRIRRRREEIDVAELVIPVDSEQIDRLHSQETMRLVTGLFESMPERLRSTLQLAYLEGLTHAEIASRTGEPLGTVKSRIRLGLEWIRKGLEVSR